MTSMGVWIAAVVVAGTNFVSPEVAHFPGSFFDTEAKAQLTQRALQKWPGSSQLVETWQTGDLNRREKMAILLAASATHDPVLLPIYRDAIVADNERLRMAAAYGYRDLLGDLLPDLRQGVDRRTARLLAGEMDAVAETLRARPLVEFWLQGALASEGRSMPGWRGVYLRRPSSTCLLAVEKIVTFDDFYYVATAYRLAGNTSTRIGLMRLLEAITFREFQPKVTGGRAGWGSQQTEASLDAADRFVEEWIDRRCSTDPGRILAESMAAMGAGGVRPMEPSSYEFWLYMLKSGSAARKMMAGRRLYELGGRWSNLSMFQAESPQQAKVFDGMVGWYLLLPEHVGNRKRPTPPAGP